MRSSLASSLPLSEGLRWKWVSFGPRPSPMASASVLRLRVGSGAWDVSSSCLHKSFAPAAKTECKHYVHTAWDHHRIIRNRIEKRTYIPQLRLKRTTLISQPGSYNDLHSQPFKTLSPQENPASLRPFLLSETARPYPLDPNFVAVDGGSSA